MNRWYRLALSILLFGAILWLWIGRYDALSYHTWKDSKLIDIGDAVSFSQKEEKVPLNSYVSVTGVLGNKAATISGLRAGSFRFGRYQVRHLLGSKLYVEYNEAQYHDQFRPFTRINVSGRLTSFGPGSELEKVRTFFKDYYNQKIDDNAMLIVVDEEPRSQIVYILLFLLSIVLLLFSFFSTYRAFAAVSKEPS